MPPTDEIYGAIDSRGNTTTNAKASKDDDDEEGAHAGNTSVMGMHNGTHGGHSLINSGEGHRLSQSSYQRYLSRL